MLTLSMSGSPMRYRLLAPLLAGLAGVVTATGAWADDAAQAKCDHYARIALVQVATARKANCSFVGDPRWQDRPEAHKAACLRTGGQMADTEIAQREQMLAGCLRRPERAERVCGAYADTAVRQFQSATDAGCGLDGPSWSGSRERHFRWCLGASQEARDSASAARDQQLATCTAEAGRRQACATYAQQAVQQALRNDNEGCGLNGPGWSRYADDHVSFCMGASDGDLRRETARRDAALASCTSRARVNVDCDRYAKRAVEMSRINRERNCGNRGEIWSPDYRDHYEMCMASNEADRHEQQRIRREALAYCSSNHGFTLELQF